MKIICIGRNYTEHARELNNPVNDEPVIFLKPETALLHKRMPFFIPDFSNDIHYEAEIVVKISKLGKNINKKFAHRYFDEVTIGIDFTARDLQSKLKSKGLPWETAKAFDGSAAVGSFVPKSRFEDLNNLNFSLNLNNQQVQTGHTADMIYPIDTIITHASRFFTLKKGDLIFTGTPKGVGKIEKGDELEGYVEDESLLRVKVR